MLEKTQQKRSPNFSRPDPVQTPSANLKVKVPATCEDPCHNPQCASCGIVIIPSPKATLPLTQNPSIAINNWKVYTRRNPILNAAEIEELESVCEFPVPEMIFGNNKVEIFNDELKWGIQFDGKDALLMVKNHKDLKDPNQELLKVSYADQWYSSRSHKSADGIMELYKPFDWTYTTEYRGREMRSLDKKLVRSDTAEIPIAKLQTRDPILFFDDMILFEDELGDNGVSMLSIKIRVMPTCLLVLQRFFMRVDNVAFRIFDTRVFVDFEDDTVVREFKQQAADYLDVVKQVKKSESDPRSLLRDPNWVSQRLKTVFVEREELN